MKIKHNKFNKPAKALKLALATIVSAMGAMSPVNTLSSEGQPKLFEPYAPKPSGKCPEGWEIKILDGSQVENSTTLNSGKDIKVTVPAYEIVARTSPETIVTRDPGFDPVLGTTQRATIGAILTDYSEATIDLQARLEKVTKELEAGLGASAKESPTAEDKKKEEVKKTEPPNEKKKSNSSSR